ncbi:MAG: TonB-dependent receptor [Methylococcaceae bacterium]|nr:TonB-dependent receptor [Methylococcaceae bacterium]
MVFPNKPIPPSSAEQYEGGVKIEFFGGRLRSTLAYYDLTKTNVTTSDPSHPGFNIAQGAVHSRGPELDIQGEILPGWNVIATYANIDSRISKSNDGNVGSRQFNVPRNTGSVWSTYELQSGIFEGLKFGGGVTLRDSQEACCDAPPFKLAGYATVDLLAGYSRQFGDTKVSVQLNVNNLLDKHYFTGIGTFNDPFQMAWADFGQPRTFMGQVSVQY